MNPDWRRILRYAWSIRILAAAALLSGAEVFLPLIHDSLTLGPLTYALAMLGLTMSALVARIVAQSRFKD